jgi:hypothetical protein
MVTSKVIVLLAFTIILGDEARAEEVIAKGYTYSKGRIYW